MNAESLLYQVAKALQRVRLEVILIGNAGAALHGAPVTTLDFDFMFRKSPTNLRKLKQFSTELDALILRPYYPVSELYRVINEDRGLQVDFMGQIHGIKSFSSLRSRAQGIPIGNQTLWLASLDDIIRSKKAAGRPRDKAVLKILEATLHEKAELKKSQTPRP